MEVVVAGDFNSKSFAWGSGTEDVRGQILSETVITYNLTPVNVGNRPTFQRGNAESVIDITFVRLGRLTIRDWRIFDATVSHHKYIRFLLVDESSQPPEPEETEDLTPSSHEHTGWAYRRIDVTALRRFLQETPDPKPAVPTTDDAAKSLREYLEEGVHASSSYSEH